MDKPPKHYASEINQDRRPHIAWCHLYEMSFKRPIYRQSRWVPAEAGVQNGNSLQTEQQDILEDDGNVLKVDCGDGCTTG